MVITLLAWQAAGMAHVVSQPTPPFRAASGAYEVHQIPAAQDNLIWLLVCKRTGAAAIVDGPDADAVLAYAQDQGIAITHVLNTHTHHDHVGVNKGLQSRGLLDKLAVLGPAKAATDVPGITRPVDEGDTIEVGACKARVMRTEGHIVGHICFVFDDVLFSGDTLFTGGCGRVFTGDFSAMHDGLTRLAKLDPALRVCCGHEYTEDNLRFALSVEPENAKLQQRYAKVHEVRATGASVVPALLQEELETNPMLRSDSRELIEHVRSQAPDADLSSQLGVFTTTRKLKDGGAYKR
jgi:hydroxyacylglutathione hydrolase